MNWRNANRLGGSKRLHLVPGDEEAEEAAQRLLEQQVQPVLDWLIAGRQLDLARYTMEQSVPGHNLLRLLRWVDSSPDTQQIILVRAVGVWVWLPVRDCLLTVQIEAAYHPELNGGLGQPRVRKANIARLTWQQTAQLPALLDYGFREVGYWQINGKVDLQSLGFRHLQPHK